MTEPRKYTAELRFGYADTGGYYVAGAAVGSTADEAVNLLRDSVDYTRQEVFERFSNLRNLVTEEADSEEIEQEWFSIFSQIVDLKLDYEAVWVYEGLPQDLTADDYPEPEDPEREFAGLRIYEKVGN